MYNGLCNLSSLVVLALEHPGRQFSSNNRGVKISEDFSEITVFQVRPRGEYVDCTVYPLAEFIKDELNRFMLEKEDPDYVEFLTKWSVMLN